MAFDPDEFIKSNKGSAAAPEVQPGGGGFDPDEFIKNTPAYVPGSEPALVADVPAAGVSAPGQPMTMPPQASGVAPQLPIGGYGSGVMDAAKSAVMGTQLGQNAAQLAQPYATAGSKVVNAYVNNPITKLAPDLAAAAAGFPPPYATSQAIGATQGAYNVGKKLAAAPAAAPAPVNPMMQTEFGQEIARRAAAAEAETMANRSVIQKIAMSKVMQMAAPALNTAARVAGPAGLAYNAYEAGNMARETQLGERLAAGQGRAAPQAFRQMNPQYGSGFNQSITADQARSILSSGNARDIQAFGGMDALRKRALGM